MYYANIILDGRNSSHPSAKKWNHARLNRSVELFQVGSPEIQCNHFHRRSTYPTPIYKDQSLRPSRKNIWQFYIEPPTALCSYSTWHSMYITLGCQNEETAQPRTNASRNFVPNPLTLNSTLSLLAACASSVSETTANKLHRLWICFHRWKSPS